MQKQILMERFQATEYLNKEEKCKLAMSINTTEKVVDNWFSYMRRKEAARGMFSQSEY